MARKAQSPELAEAQAKVAKRERDARYRANKKQGQGQTQVVTLREVLDQPAIEIELDAIGHYVLETTRKEMPSDNDLTVTLMDLDTLHWDTPQEALIDVCGAWELTVRSGWTFIALFEKAIAQFTTDQESRVRFMGEVANQTHVSIKRLQNMLSIGRSESALMAKEYGLEIGHGDVLARLADPEEAATYAALAAEQSWTVADLRFHIKQDKGELPVSVAMVSLEIEAGSMLDDMCARVANFVRNQWGEDGVQALREWLQE